ncbi:MAG: alpha-galactosidase [Lentisphaerae bacterium]|jgi:alpha-galactosidase|nr:alpha-galactosidase [Lentisphaerota bacterium]
MKITFSFNSKEYQTLDVSGEYLQIPVLPVRKSGMLQIRFSLPILDFHRYWTPDSRVPSSKIFWTIETTSAAQRNFPFLSFFNIAQQNRASIALNNLIDDCRILARMNQERCTYDLTISVSICEETEEFCLILDCRDQPWTRCLADYRKKLDIPEQNFPAAAWEPVYCTWYAVHAAVTSDWVEKNAAIAAELGFSTLIIDDGWCFEQMKRVSPETITTWYENIGNWEVAPGKFPDFIAHVRRVQKMGLRYLLWVAPFLIGDRSKIYEELKSATDEKYLEGYHLLNVQKRKEAERLLKMIASLLEKYPIDGLKIDFLDQYFPNLEQPRGRATLDFIARLSAAIRNIRSDALIEFRQSYATPGMLPYATQFRAGDVPFDFLDNFQRLAQIRIGLGDRVPVHADPVYWHPQESAVNIARHMIASLAGVPMLSMEMTTLSDLESRIIRNWLQFYRDHLETFKTGTWHVQYQQSAVSYISVRTDEEQIIILNDEKRLEMAMDNTARKHHILNLSPAPLRLPGCTATGPAGEECPAGCIPLGGRGFR